MRKRKILRLTYSMQTSTLVEICKEPEVSEEEMGIQAPHPAP